MNDDYYVEFQNPDDLPVEVIAEVELVGEPYSFDSVILVRSDGKLYAAADSGCSCPAPYEGHTFPTDFVEVRKVKDVEQFVDSSYHAGQYVQELRRTTEEALNA